MKMWRFLPVVLLLLIPALSSAHTRWFAEGTMLPYTSLEPTSMYLAVWAAIVGIIVMIGIYFERCRIMELGFCKPRAPHAFERAAAVFTMVVGSFFIIAGAYGYLFSPNLTTWAGIPPALFFLEILIGILFLVGFLERIAAIALIGLWASIGYFTNSVFMLEDIWVLSTALFVFVMGNDYFSLVGERTLKGLAAPFQAYAMPFLRIGTGATLFVLGFSEKILHPELGMHFLQIHPWNFMQLLGFEWFTDYLFVISAGSVEALFGLIFILGVATRLNALVLGIVFSIPIFILGPIELTGHLPHFAAVILLLLFGCGGHWKIAYPRAKTKTRTA